MPDGDSLASATIAQAIFNQIRSKAKLGGRLARQSSGGKFEQITRSFVEQTFRALKGLRPGKWNFIPETRSIFRFDRYRDLAELSEVAKKNPEIDILLGSDYVIVPDVLVVRETEPDETINRETALVDDSLAPRAEIRRKNNALSLLHASISCKWTLRSDAAQNDRSEALNLMRNGNRGAAHTAVVTGEPLPSRLASVALGTQGIDCVYHFALPELMIAVKELGDEDSSRLVRIMVEARRLKDITDLPLDLAV